MAPSRAAFGIKFSVSYLFDFSGRVTLNGEWEGDHDFMCSSCATVFDELREILHHKWEAHPYCLVTHVTLKRDLRLPPSNLIHPQIGRNLGRQNSVKMIGRKSSPMKRKPQIVQDQFKCSKCLDEKVFDKREDFYVHLLECGGDVDWDVSKKKKKKKKGYRTFYNKTMRNYSTKGVVVVKKEISAAERGKNYFLIFRR